MQVVRFLSQSTNTLASELNREREGAIRLSPGSWSYVGPSASCQDRGRRNMSVKDHHGCCFEQCNRKWYRWWRFTHSVLPTLCDPMDCSPPGSSVHGILQARILEWVAISFSRGSSWLRDQIRVSCIGRQMLYY